MSKLEKLLYPSEGRKNILYAGKGGVGKTTMACVTAVKTALAGYRTLLLTTDPAAHIANVLDIPVYEEISLVQGIPNLYAVKIDQKRAVEEYKKKVIEDAKGKFNEDTVAAMEEELNSPCTEEIAAFQKFIEFASGGEYQVIVFDTAPTGHTLRLLELPMDWSRQLELKAGISNEISEADLKQKERFDQVVASMRDKASTTLAFVMYPEKTPIAEAHRASLELESFGISTQLVVANLLIPEEQASSAFFKNRRAMQLKYLEEIRQKFQNAYVFEFPMHETDIKGIELLKKLASNTYK